MDGWPNLLACIAVYVAFLVWASHVSRREDKAGLRGIKPKAGVWNADLMQFATFRTTLSVLCVLLLTIILVSASAIFGVLITTIGFAIILVWSKLSDLYGIRLYRKELDMNTSTMFTDCAVSQHIYKARRRKFRRHCSYIVTRKKRR